MSDIQQQEHRNKRSGTRSKKLSTRVDLTPMVDLGFLLITFFIFTTTLHEARMMQLFLPADRNLRVVAQAPASKTLSLILEANDRIYYYHGLNKEQWGSTGYSATELRNLIQQKLNEVQTRFGKRSETIILIKPTAEASYRNIVAVLDEMLINDVKRYVLMDPSAEETHLGTPSSAGG
jgi:biopolymer transport protein ExbD